MTTQTFALGNVNKTVMIRDIRRFEQSKSEATDARWADQP
jgi:hypothetical protein